MRWLDFSLVPATTRRVSQAGSRLREQMGGLYGCFCRTAVTAVLAAASSLVVFATGIHSSPALGQENLPGRSSFERRQLSGQPGSRGESLNSNPGGAAAADFNTLMSLIQQTVDPDSWITNGGSSTMLPYPAGVWVDPAGQVKRVAIKQSASSLEIDQFKPPAAAAGSAANRKGHWLTSSKMRMVSLKLLDQYLREASLHQGKLTADSLRVAGLNRISYVIVDAQSEDIILAGPAFADKPGFFLEDLSVICAAINQQTSPLGCSIDPTTEALAKTQAFAKSAEASKLLSSSPEHLANRLEQIIGPQQISVFGMPARSGTAISIVAADQHMKQLSFGKAKLPINIKTYFQHLEEQPQIPDQSLVRWWFAYGQQPVSVNEAGDLFRLPLNCVQILSDQQMLTAAGRQPSGSVDPAAEAFAKELSEAMDQIRQVDSNYSRTCCFFECGLAIQCALESVGMRDFRAWLPNLCQLGLLDQPFVNAPKETSGLVSHHSLKKRKTNLAVVSGGVLVSPQKLASPERWHRSSLMTGSGLPSTDKPESAASQWWWDQISQ